jgi:YD repeat-containing protein
MLILCDPYACGLCGARSDPGAHRDGLRWAGAFAGHSSGTTIAQSSSTSYTVALGVSTLSSESSNAYEQAITLDSYNHQSITYTDGLGRTRYAQTFSGTTGPYTVVRTVGTTYDVVGNTLSTLTYDGIGTLQASYTATYDGAKRLLGYNDSDQGSCQDSPMPSDCSSSTDNAWKYTYDADGNQVSSVDPNNNQVYTSYDALDRPLCAALLAADAADCGASAFNFYFYDSYDSSSNPLAIMPDGCDAPSGSYASDPVGHETAEFFTSESGAGDGWRCYGYDQRGRTDQSTLSVLTPDAGTITQTVNMTYDDQNDQTSLVYPDGEVLTSNYNSDGRFQSAYFGSSSTPDPVSFLVGQTGYT